MAVHIFIIAGQSNAVGQAPDDGGAAFPANTYHYNATDTWQPIGSRVYHAQSPGQTELPDAAASFGFARQFAIAYAAENPGVDLYFVGAAKGSTSFVGNNWNPGDAVYNASVARANAAIAAAPGGSVLKGILWHQGESDKLLSGEAAYEAALTAMIPAYRAAVTGATNVPFVLGGQFFKGGSYGETVQNVVQSMPNSINYTGYADSSSPVEIPVQADTIHATAAGQRGFGPQFLKGLKEAQLNAVAAPSGGAITVGTMAQYSLASSASQTITGLALGAAAADRIICVAIHSRSSFVQNVQQIRIAGIDMARVGTPETLGSQCNTALFYAVVPTGTTGTLEVIMTSAPDATQFAATVLPVYGAKPHLARTKGFSHARNTGTSVASISTPIDVVAGDLIFAASGSINPGSNAGSFSLLTTVTGQFGGTFAAHAGYEVVTADAAARSITCSFSTNTQKPTINAMVLRPAGVSGVIGSGASEIALSGAATGTVKVAGAVVGTLALSGSGVGAVVIKGLGIGTIDLTGTGAGSLVGGITGAGNGNLPLAGSGTGKVTIAGAGQVTLALDGTGAGKITVRGIAAGIIDLSGGGTGSLQSGTLGAGQGSIALDGAAQGSVRVTGAAAGFIALTGQGASEAISPVLGAAAGIIDLSGTGAGKVFVRGGAASIFAISGQGSQAPLINWERLLGTHMPKSIIADARPVKLWVTA